MSAIPFIDWLPEVVADEILVVPDDILAEAHGNLWSFALNAAQAAGIDPEAGASFVRAVVAARGRWLAVRDAAPMLFYCWHDQQAVQLRLSLVSVRHGRLPFDCAIERSVSLESIVASFLGSPYHDGIPLPEESKAGSGESVATKPLPVWVVTLPSAAAFDEGADVKLD